MGSQTTKARPAKAATRYEDDTFTWVSEQIALLRAGRRDLIDVENIAEELSDLGNELRFRLESAIAVLSLHILKWDHQKARRSRSWQITVREQRKRIALLLKRNPGLKGVLSEAIEVGYDQGRDRAIAETKMKDEAIPETCPYTFDEMMTRVIEIE